MIKIKAHKDEDTGFLSFKCEWCKRIHHHGQGYGPRVSHCSKFNGQYELIPEEEGDQNE